jgi:hypothetical protein
MKTTAVSVRQSYKVQEIDPTDVSYPADPWSPKVKKQTKRLNDASRNNENAHTKERTYQKAVPSPRGQNQYSLP